MPRMPPPIQAPPMQVALVAGGTLVSLAEDGVGCSIERLDALEVPPPAEGIP